LKLKFFQHPTALVESAHIGAGTRIWAFAHLLKGARVGRDCNIGDHAFVEGGARIGNNVTVKNGVTIWEGVEIRDNAFIGPHAAFTNDLNPRSPRFLPVRKRYADKKNWLVKTVVGEGASIGCNATIVCGVTIGKFAMIGAGAVVTRDVPPYALVLGVPSSLRGYVCECGQRLEFSNETARCGVCGSRYQLRRGKVVKARQHR
jgi:UDP-2-acetamido-3-amino-2,3-dideoxy-glucuronate N-acetyltransferase